MIIIDNVIVSDEILEAKFVCDLGKCKGGCCEEGDAGAPLEKEEMRLVKKHYPAVKKYLTPQAIAIIEEKGFHTYDEEFGNVTPVVDTDNGICVYAIRENTGLISCAFEKAYNQGEINWKKPISCHLYPIVVYKGKYGDYNRMNYYPREVLCKPACVLGEKLKLPVYQFLKEPIVRKYGNDFFNALHDIALHLDNNSEKGHE